MEVPNDEWTAVVFTNGDKGITQNVGDPRIGFVVAASAPDDSDPLEDGSHGILLPGSAPMTLLDLETDSLTMFVRALGPRAGLLYVS